MRCISRAPWESPRLTRALQSPPALQEHRDKSVLTKAVQNVVEVVEIVITFFHNCFVADCVVHPAVGICNCARAGWRNQDKESAETGKARKI